MSPPASTPKQQPHLPQQTRQQSLHQSPTIYLDSLDLDADNYGYVDLCTLFGIPANTVLTDATMRHARGITLKMHPDKSRLDSKFFVFYQQAFAKLTAIFEATHRTQQHTAAALPQEYAAVLNGHGQGQRHAHDIDAAESDAMREEMLQQVFGKGENFDRRTFNESFERFHRGTARKGEIGGNGDGYGEWMKSNDDMELSRLPDAKTAGGINQAIEAAKQRMQQLMVRQEVQESESAWSSSFGGASLLGEDVGARSTAQYTDLKQAYTETLLPVSESEIKNIRTYRNVNEYQHARDNAMAPPMSKAEAERVLQQKQRQHELSAQSIAFRLAQDMERASKQNDSFWGTIRQLTNGISEPTGGNIRMIADSAAMSTSVSPFAMVPQSQPPQRR